MAVHKTRARDVMRRRWWRCYHAISWACVPLTALIALHVWPTTGSPSTAETTDTAASTLGPRVLIYGDSISRVASVAVNADLGRSYALTTHVHIGTLGIVPQGLAHEIATNDPQAVIVELGTGDALDGDRGWRAHLDAIIDTVRPVGCVGFVTVSPAIDGYFAAGGHARRDIAVQWNAAVSAAVRDTPTFHLVDWAGAVTIAPKLVYDGTHPNQQGQQWLISQYRDVLDRQCRLTT